MTENPSLELEVGSPAGDVAAALDAARPNVESLAQPCPGVELLATRNDVKVHTVDLERWADEPTRARGLRRAVTAGGFVDLVNRLGDVRTIVYADLDQCELHAVLNDDVDGLTTGWRDHRVLFTPHPTPEWKLWIGGAGLKAQDEFAAILEEGETEIRNPSATVMLELAETFHASTSAKFKQAGRRRDGRTQLVYEEEIEATAGEGMVEIPDSFTIEVRPFYGASPVEVECRLRFRVARGDLAIGYVIHRPDEIRRASFERDVIGTITSGLSDAIQVVEALAPDVPAAR